MLSKNCSFLDNFDKHLFLVHLSTGFYKSCAKVDSKLNSGPLRFYTFNYFSKNKCLSKLSKNEQFLISIVQKLTRSNIFFIKQKMLGICDFYNRFSISGPFDLSEWVPDGPEPLGAEDGLRAQQEGSI